MKYLCAQPRTPYYKWQVEALIKNFIRNGIHPNDIIILLGMNRLDYSCSAHSERVWNELYEKFPEVWFFEYLDTREQCIYKPSIYFNLVKQFLTENPSYQEEVIFYHDADILFTRPVDFSHLIEGDTWYFSDTIDYIGAKYIVSKGGNVYKDMCDIVGIDAIIPIMNQENSGGAQYIIKRTTPSFWEKVELDSIKMYNHFCETEHLHIQSGRKDYPIQKWTAGMWSLLWNAWLFGHEVKISHDMDFCVATDPIELWDKKPIMHNAQVLPIHKNLFFKENYHLQDPTDIDLSKLSNQYCSYNYAKELVNDFM